MCKLYFLLNNNKTLFDPYKILYLLKITLVALALCGFAHAANLQGADDSVTAHLGAQKLHFHEGSDESLSEVDELVSVGLAGLEGAQGRSLVANAIAGALEGFRDVVINGNEDLPSLDPLQIDQLGPFSHSSTGVRINADFRNFELTGLRWYVVEYVTFSALRLALNVRVTVPWITVTGSYDASARIGLINHNAGGNYRFFVNRLQTTVDLRVGTNILGGGTLILRQLDIDIVIHDVTVQIDGMVGSTTLNNLINSLVQGAAQNVFVDQMEEISKALSRELFDTVNDFLSNFTMDDLFG